jgi:peptidoglycan/xylan/chitin deacetylase (PgdA/CDA1 family)
MPYWKKSLKLILFSLLFCAFVQARPALIERLPTTEKVVALTFDDGPHNGSFEILLDYLAQEKVRATFFVVGKAIHNDPDLIYRLVREHHSIGNHTYHHIRLDTLPPEKITEELQKTNELIARITKKPVLFFRAPGGRYNNDVSRAAREQKLMIVNWTLNTGDYMMDVPFYLEGERVYVRQPETIAVSLLRRVQPGDIILMHTGNEETLDALKLIIPELRKRGYRFATIGDYYQ